MEYYSDRHWKIASVTEEDIECGTPGSNRSCAISLCIDRIECKPRGDNWSPETHTSDEMYINNSDDSKDYRAFYIHPDDRDNVDSFIQAYDEEYYCGGSPRDDDDYPGYQEVLKDLLEHRLSFRYRLEHGDPTKWSIDERLGI